MIAHNLKVEKMCLEADKTLIIMPFYPRPKDWINFHEELKSEFTIALIFRVKSSEVYLYDGNHSLRYKPELLTEHGYKTIEEFIGGWTGSCVVCDESNVNGAACGRCVALVCDECSDQLKDGKCPLCRLEKAFS